MKHLLIVVVMCYASFSGSCGNTDLFDVDFDTIYSKFADIDTNVSKHPGLGLYIASGALFVTAFIFALNSAPVYSGPIWDQTIKEPPSYITTGLTISCIAGTAFLCSGLIASVVRQRRASLDDHTARAARRRARLEQQKRFQEMNQMK